MVFGNFCIAAAVGMGSCALKFWECCNSDPQLVCIYITIAVAWGSENRMTPATKRKHDTFTLRNGLETISIGESF